MADVKLEARVREGRGGKDAKALRAAGEIPGVIYTSTSGKDGSTPICVGARDLRTAVSVTSGPEASSKNFSLNHASPSTARARRTR